ncbi:uncharacterized protein LOC142823535 isoform X1 [Pelodiscus sinensis]|uniref:uncharacterized protein LOC142823535 isoform X1 n=1 Tax=Pelodiscus sinensis TaxID=13735 RepID=UPI003F6BD9FF
MGQSMTNSGLVTGSIIGSGNTGNRLVSLMAPNATLYLGSSHLELAAAPEQLASWSSAEETWVLQSECASRESVTLKPGSLYRLPADREVQNPESAVRETLTFNLAFLYRGSADGVGGAEQRGGPDPDVQFIFTLPDEATLKAAASILKSLSHELTLEELWERVGQSGADRKAEAQRLLEQRGAGGVGWTSEDLELFLDALESTGICKLFQDKRKGDGDTSTGCELSQSGAPDV